MLFTFNKSSGEVDLLDETSFTEENILERKHIETWIEENPEILGEDLFIITIEFNQFDKTNERLDLLAIDRDAKLVVIELKRDDSGKNVDLQALKYAAYCSTMTLSDIIEARQKYIFKKTNQKKELEQIQSEIEEFANVEELIELDDKPRIIIASNEYRTEVMASVLWLRKFGVDITCISLKPYLFTDNKIGITANKIIPLKEAEEFQIRVDEKEHIEKKLSPRRKFYRAFWNKIHSNFNAPHDLSLKPAPPKNYYQIETGVPKLHYEFYIRRDKEFGVELHFENSNREKNLKFLNSLSSKFDAFKNITTGTFFIQKEWGKKWSRIGTTTSYTQIDDSHFKFAIREMKILIETFQPLLNKK